MGVFITPAFCKVTVHLGETFGMTKLDICMKSDCIWLQNINHQ